MKKLIYAGTLAIFALFTATSCQLDPDMGELSDEYLVYTNYDPAADFSKYTTVFVPDSILLIQGKQTTTPQYWKDANAQQILNTFKSELQGRGYTITNDKDAATLGVQVSYIQNITYFIDYIDPYWWWDYYPYYWDPTYWGDWGYWYYPYPVVYTYATGSLLADMVDLTATPGPNNKLPILWNTYITGLLSGSADFDTSLAVSAVQQAFTQSPYIQK